MVNFNSLVILCVVQLALSEDRISVDTVGTITATAGYSISDGPSPSAASLTSSIEFPSDHDSSKESSASSEAYTPTPGLRNSQSLALRSRQARGKSSQWQQSGSGEEKDLGVTMYPLIDHRSNEQLYSVKPQTFENQSPQLSDIKRDESAEKSVPSITYGKKMLKNDGHDDRPVFSDWSEEVRVKFDNEKPIRSRKKNKHQQDGTQEKRKSQFKKPAIINNDNKDGWQEVSPNLEIATGYSTTVPENDSSQETSGSSESFKTHPTLQQYSSESSGISSIENTAQTEPQNFNHKQVLSKMNHFDFSNAVPSQTNKSPSSPAREKRLNYQPSGGSGLPPPPVRYPFNGIGQPLVQPVVSSSSSLTSASPAVKSVKIEHPVTHHHHQHQQQQPNYHSIVVPIPVSHQMYAAIGGGVDGQQLASSTMQQAMMSLPVVHNVFFKTDEHGGGKTMPAIVIPLKPEYLQHLQQQQYLHQQQQQLHPSLLQDIGGADSQNAAGHQRPSVHGGGAGSKTVPFQHQLPSPLPSSPLPSSSPSGGYQQKPNTLVKVKKPFNLIKTDEHRIKHAFNLQQSPHGQLFGSPYAGHHHHQHGGLHHQHHQQQLGDSADDSRFAQTASPGYAAGGHSLIVKRPNAYGYAASPKYVTGVNKASPPAAMSAEDVASAMVQQQIQSPYKSPAAYHPSYAYLTGPQDDDYPYRPIYKDAGNNRNDMMTVRSE